MKKTLFTISFFGLVLAGATTVSAQYYYPNQSYNNYQNNYVVSSYVPQTLNNCYYTASYPVTYYGTCVGTGANYNYGNYGYSSGYSYSYPYSNYQNNYNYVTPTTYTGYSNPSQYTTYGYSNGSWYPGYSSNTISNLFNGNSNYGYNGSYNNNCYYQNGYQVCY